MNIKYLTILTVLAAGTVSLPLYAIDSYTLPSGKVLENPTIVSRNPVGIEVAHSKGVIFLKYSELPKDVQKKLNYSPKKEQQYTKNLQARRRQQAKVKREKAKIAAAEQRKYDLVILERAQQRLADKIAATELRIKFLESEIPKLENMKSKTFDSSNSLASRSSYRGGGFTGYYAGTRNYGGSDRSERTKRDTINALNSEYEEAKRDLKMSQQSLKNKKFELIKMKRLYKRHEAELEKKRAEIARDNGAKGGKKGGKKSFVSGVTSLFK